MLFFFNKFCPFRAQKGTASKSSKLIKNFSLKIELRFRFIISPNFSCISWCYCLMEVILEGNVEIKVESITTFHTLSGKFIYGIYQHELNQIFIVYFSGDWITDERLPRWIGFNGFFGCGGGLVLCILYFVCIVKIWTK